MSGVSDFFGLDIGTTAVRLVQLRGAAGAKQLVKYAYVPLDSKLALSDAKPDQDALGQVISQLLVQAKLTTPNVAVGIPSNRVFTTVADVDRLPGNELSKAIQYQADSLIPTPLAESKIDWAVLGDSPADKTKQEIVLSSVPNTYVESRLDMLEGLGLNVIAFEPDYLALARSIATEATQQIQFIVDVGFKSTDIVGLLNGMPRLTRSIPTGSEAIVRSAAQNLNIEDTQAEQFVYKFGLNKDKLDGQVYQAINGTVDILMTEFEKSIKFLLTRYAGQAVDRLIVTGGASAIPEFPLYMANKFGLNVTIGNAWGGVSFSQERQNELSALSNHFGVAVGLAERAE